MRGDIIKNFDEVFRLAKEKKSTVAVAAADSAHILEMAAEAVGQGIASMILVGDASKIFALAKEMNINIDNFEIVDEADEFAACQAAVELVKSGRATALMKGDTETSTIMRAVLCRETGIRAGKKLSHVAVFETPNYHKLLFAADCAVNIAPDFDTKIDIIENTVDALRNMGINLPKVALLAAKEKVDDKMPITQEYAQIVALHKSGERMQNCIVDGPLALDNAVSVEACEIKGINSPVGGDADILFCPNIEAGNILYKSLSFITKAKNGGVVLGAKRPIILTSRADSAESKLISIALSVLF
ncbi:MAG: bifunctional enoyl-CoA hydratase/phosphate acetyltransferase [Clostridiales bacterium]|nr:bifunctional enoyl-CoA hydratase/phosphate acetyltransferase [Clostridiales bacterium]